MSKNPYIRKHLSAVSPSTYVRLKAWKDGKACGLQLLWAGAPPLAPFPAAKLGDVVHNVMEAAGAGMDYASANQLWDRKCEEVDANLRNKHVTRGLAPLSLTVKGYELRKLMAIRMACQAAPALLELKWGLQSQDCFHQIKEEELVSKDCKLKGRVDLVEHRAEGWVLVDYKSGAVIDVEEDGRTQIKEGYKLQLLLYAALLAEVKGVKVKKSVLKTLDGKEHEVSFVDDQIREAASQARQLLSEFNASASKANDDPNSLALPLPTDRTKHIFGCGGCFYRPLCKPYLQADKVNAEGCSWPKDFFGEIAEINKRFILLKEEKSERPFKFIFELDYDRHVFLQKPPQVGEKLKIFDYIFCRDLSRGYCGPRTNVYY